jgi:hypothetical protein
MKYIPTDILRCPHCGSLQGAQADDFVVPGRTGIDSAFAAECAYCNEEFFAERLEDGLISVEGVKR